MLSITVGARFGPEKRYAAEVLVGQILGLDASVSVADGRRDSEITLANGKRLVIKDNFTDSPQDAGYLSPENIPRKVHFVKNEFIVEPDVPAIFGTADLAVSEERIVCGLDILASAYFMLARWEEYVNPVRDPEGRFPATASVAYRNGFLHRPVVNEYAEMLGNMLSYLGLRQPGRKSEFVIRPTHDIDRVYYPCSLTYLGGDVLRTRSLINPLKRLSYAIARRNHWDTFQYLMDKSERCGVKSLFYFLGKKGATAADYNLDDRFIRERITDIMGRGHEIGVHLSKESVCDIAAVRQEKRNIENVCGRSVADVRRHYLLFSCPATWQMHHEAGFGIDSTVGYHDRPGFRCGTGMEFPVFNFLTGDRLPLKERPLLFMDGSMYSARAGYGAREHVATVLDGIIGACRKYRMPCTVLFHNSSFDPIRWPGWYEIYDAIMR